MRAVLPSVLVLALAGSSCSPVPDPGDLGGSGGSSTTGGGGKGGTGPTSSSGGTGGNSSTAGKGGSNSGGGSGESSGGSGDSTGGSGGSGDPTSGSGGSGGLTGGSSGGKGGGAGGKGGSAGSGSSSSDGPTADSSSPAAGTCAATMKFCSDFETQTAGGAPQSGDFTVSGSSITVDGAKAFSGTKSIHFKPSGNKAQLVFKKQFPINEQHGRLMMFVTKTPTAAVHWDIIQSNNATNIWSWGGMYGKYELVVDPPDDGIDSGTAIPSGKWVCVQWTFGQGTGGKSEYRVQMDGKEVDGSPQIGHWKAGAWKDLLVGWEVFGSASIDFWIDDLAFGEQAIACPAAP